MFLFFFFGRKCVSHRVGRGKFLAKKKLCEGAKVPLAGFMHDLEQPECPEKILQIDNSPTEALKHGLKIKKSPGMHS